MPTQRAEFWGFTAEGWAEIGSMFRVISALSLAESASKPIF
jgi:hypothetical protein